MPLSGIIVCGAGQDFSSGLDVKAVMSSPWTIGRLLWKSWPTRPNLVQRISFGWRRLPLPVIFALHGRCWGAALQVALGGDFRIATPDCSLSIMEGRWGLVPDMGGILSLRELLPLDLALALTMTAKTISGTDAGRYHLITDVASDPMAAAYNLAAEIMQRSPDAVAATKQLCYRAYERHYSQILLHETIRQGQLILGTNQKRIRKQQGVTDIEYVPRSRWM